MSQSVRPKIEPETPNSSLRFLLATALVVASASASAAPLYSIKDLGTLGGLYSFGQGINDAGQVTGYSATASGDQHAFVTDSSGRMIDLGTLGGVNSVGTGINAAGQVTGYSETATGTNHAFVTKSSGFGEFATPSSVRMVDLGTLPGYVTSFGTGINDGGKVTGYSVSASGVATAFVTNSIGGMTALGTLGGSASIANAINASGQVTGNSLTASGANHAFVTDSSGRMTDLGTLPGFVNSSGFGINAAGQVTGEAFGVTTTRAFVTNSSGKMIDLGALPGSTGQSEGHGINAAGQVTGLAITSGGPHAFITNSGVMTDLNSLLGPSGIGWTLQIGTAINNLGQITGYGINPLGRTDAFLLTPVTSPAPSPPPVPDSPATRRGSAHLANALDTPIDPSKPTIVLTHGWEPGVAYNPDVSPLVNLKNSVKTALQNLDGSYRANILTFQWQDAFDPSPGRPLLVADNAGAILAKEIERDFGPSYSGNIQLVGHSYGTLVNSHAAQDLAGYFTSKTFPIDQLTFLDPPIPIITADVYYSILPRGTIQYVDNFWAGISTGGVGAPLFGAAPSGGELVIADHSGVQDTFYAGRVLKPSLWVTAIDGSTYATRPAPEVWTGVSLLKVLVGITTEFAVTAWRSIVSTAEELTTSIGKKLTSWIRLRESSPVMVARELTIPAEAKFLTFDFGFLDVGDGDWLTVNFGDKLLWTFLGTDFINDLMTATISVADLAGQEGTLYITLNSTGERNADVYIGDIAFASFSTASVVPEPSNIWLILVGYVALITIVQRRTVVCLVIRAGRSQRS